MNLPKMPQDDLGAVHIPERRADAAAAYCSVQQGIPAET